MKLFFALILLVITTDQLTKKLAVALLHDGPGSFPIIGDLLSLTYAENRGVAFSLEFAPSAILLLLTGLITAGVIAYVVTSKNRTPLFLVPFAFIVGGGAGNMIDRITIGRVVDFIYFNLYHGTILGIRLDLWPIFNVADSAITIGACMLILFHSRLFAEAAPGEGNDVR
ncbi:MAG: signal peptidase II [Chlorobiaceae bacterium]